MPESGFTSLLLFLHEEGGSRTSFVKLSYTVAMALVKGLSENQGARMFHLMMIIPAGVLLLLVSLLSLGTMANANKQIKQELDDIGLHDKCILYTKVEGEDESKTFKLNGGGECNFVVWGDAVLAILAVVLSIVLGVKTFFGIAV